MKLHCDNLINRGFYCRKGGASLFDKLFKRHRPKSNTGDINAYVKISKPIDKSGDTNISVLYNGKKEYFSKVGALKCYLGNNDLTLRAVDYSTEKYLNMYGIKNNRLQ